MRENNESNGRNPWIFIGGIFVLGIALALLLFGGDLFGSGDETAVFEQIPDLGADDGEIPIPLSGAPLNIGDQAHAFTLNDLDGNEIALGDYAGRPILVNFWATWCAPCRLEMPEFQKIRARYSDDELAILAVNYDEDPDYVRRFFYDELGLTFTPLLDTGHKVANAYGAVGLPATFFINANGKVTNIHRGLLTEGQLNEYLADILPQTDT
ncbi:MAG: TlpA family protein disulfide reductase [Anaerolineales bacterium]|nr:TlpA family protein disulfide reductase [Anaerolineales bacterium]